MFPREWGVLAWCLIAWENVKEMLGGEEPRATGLCPRQRQISGQVSLNFDAYSAKLGTSTCPRSRNSLRLNSELRLLKINDLLVSAFYAEHMGENILLRARAH